MSVPPVDHIGLVTRGIAFALDAAVVNVVAIVVAAGIALVLSVVDVSGDLDPWIAGFAGAAFVGWTILYFVVFWSTTGQTPGDRLMRIRVCRAEDGNVLPAHSSLVRYAGLVLSAIPLFAGFLPILFDRRRRGVHDMLAGTVVVAVPR